MEGFSDRLRLAREANQLTQDDVARWFKIARESVADWESGKTKPHSAKLPILVAKLNTTYDWLIENRGEPPTLSRFGDDKDRPEKTVTTVRMRGHKPQLVMSGSGRRKLVTNVPVFAAAMGGKGHVIIDMSPIEDAVVPDLAGVLGGYGILIVGESMIPAFRPGDVAWVNPNKLPERETEVVLYHVPPHGAEAEAIIKTLVSFNDKSWKLKQYSPPQEWTESRIDWSVCHRVVGKRNVR